MPRKMPTERVEARDERRKITPGYRKFIEAGAIRGPGRYTATQTGAKALAIGRLKMENREKQDKINKILKEQERRRREQIT